MADTSDEPWDQVLAVNLTAPFYLCRAFIPIMMTRRDRERGVGCRQSAAPRPRGLLRQASPALWALVGSSLWKAHRTCG